MSVTQGANNAIVGATQGMFGGHVIDMIMGVPNSSLTDIEKMVELVASLGLNGAYIATIANYNRGFVDDPTNGVIFSFALMESQPHMISRLKWATKQMRSALHLLIGKTYQLPSKVLDAVERKET